MPSGLPVDSHVSGGYMHPLSKVIVILDSSFPQFLRYAPAWQAIGDSVAAHAITDVADGQELMVQRLANYCDAKGIAYARGQFPLKYAELIDLSQTFILRKVKEFHLRDIRQIQACVDACRDELDRAWAEEALGVAQAHQDVLEGLTTTAAG